MIQRLRERTDDGWIIHVDNSGGDCRTLCGYAYEGSCTGEGDTGVEPIGRGKINCADCLEIIWYCQDIPKRMLAPPDSRKIKRAR